MFAVIRTGGKQYRVQQGDSIVVEKLDALEGSDVTFDDVLVVGDDAGVSVGAPAVMGAAVSGRVEAHLRAAKVPVYKYKNKTRRRTFRGHRQHQTRVAIIGIRPGS